MRIGMFADMYKPHVSGVTNYISLYKQHFQELGHEVFVFTYGNRDYHDDEPNVVRSPAISWGNTGWQMGFALSSTARKLIPTLDIAHVHHPFVSGRAAIDICRPAAVPIVFTNHTRYDLYSDAYARFIPRGLRMAFLRRTLHDFASRIDTVIAPSPGILAWLSDFGITDHAILHSNAVDTLPFAHPRSPNARTDFGLPEDSVVHCYLGRVGAEKNMELLVDAFIRAAEADSRVCLLVIGDGPARGAAQERLWAHGLTGRVHFAGSTPYDRVPDVIAAADTFVTASVSEVHPLVVMEAMAAGLPAIGIHSPGVGDIIEHGVTGLLVNEDVHEFARAMLTLTHDEGLRRSMSVTARTKAADYDIRPLGNRMLGLYETLLSSRAL